MKGPILKAKGVLASWLLTLLSLGMAGCGGSFSLELIEAGGDDCFQEDIVQTECHFVDVVVEDCFEELTVVEICEEDFFGIFFCTEEVFIDLICEDIVVDVIEVCEDVVIDSFIVCD